MYNQFKAYDQVPIPMSKVILDPLQIPKNKKRKKRKLNSKNPYKIRKIKLKGEEALTEKILDGILFLKLLHFEHPK